MIEKFISWVLANGRWKTVLFVVGILLTIAAIVTQVLWLMFFGPPAMAPKALETLDKEHKKTEKDQKKIDEETKRKKTSIEVQEQRENAERRKREQETEQQNKERIPEQESAEEIARKILQGIDQTGK